MVPEGKIFWASLRVLLQAIETKCAFKKDFIGRIKEDVNNQVSRKPSVSTAPVISKVGVHRRSLWSADIRKILL